MLHFPLPLNHQAADEQLLRSSSHPNISKQRIMQSKKLMTSPSASIIIVIDVSCFGENLGHKNLNQQLHA